jgi:hypothetical protein
LGIEDQAMRENGDGHLLDMVRGDTRRAIEKGQRLAQLHQGEGSSRAGPESDTTCLSRSSNQIDNVPPKFIADSNPLHGMAEVQDIVDGGAGLELIQRMMMRLGGEQCRLLLWGDVTQGELDGEAIHLSFRQRVSAPEFDGVLGGDHEEQLRECPSMTLDADLTLRHGFQECGLGAG